MRATPLVVVSMMLQIDRGGALGVHVSCSTVIGKCIDLIGAQLQQPKDNENESRIIYLCFKYLTSCTNASFDREEFI